MFNNILHATSSGSIQTFVDFISNNTNCIYINITNVKDLKLSSMEYKNSSGSTIHVYFADGDWFKGEAYKTITITSKLSEVTNGDALLAFLQANATKQ